MSQSAPLVRRCIDSRGIGALASRHGTAAAHRTGVLRARRPVRPAAARLRRDRRGAGALRRPGDPARGHAVRGPRPAGRRGSGRTRSRGGARRPGAAVPPAHRRRAHRTGGGGRPAGDQRPRRPGPARGASGMSPLEQRYRRLLQWLPEPARSRWADDMTETYLSVTTAGDPEYAEFGSPTVADRLDVARLALALRLGAPGASVRAVAAGRTVRLVAVACTGALGSMVPARLAATGSATSPR